MHEVIAEKRGGSEKEGRKEQSGKRGTRKRKNRNLRGVRRRDGEKSLGSRLTESSFLSFFLKHRTSEADSHYLLDERGGP